MADPKNSLEHGPYRNPAEEEAIASLLRLAGPRPPVPQECRDRVRQAVRTHWQQSVLWRRRRRVAAWVVGSLAAAATVFITIGPGLRRGPPTLPVRIAELARAEIVRGTVHSRLLGLVKPADTIEIGDEVQTSVDGRVSVRLGNGTSLRVDTGSRLELVDESVLILHEGAVYVDTELTGGATSSVEIRTPLGTVFDIGTQFEVRLESGSMRLRVRQGAVDLKHGAGNYRAEAGQQLLADGEGEVITSVAPTHGEAWRWTLEIAPTFELEGRSLDAFLSWVAGETGWQVRFEDDSIADGASSLILHGSIEGLRPDESPAAVLPTCGLRHRLEDGFLVIGRLTGRQ